MPRGCSASRARDSSSNADGGDCSVRHRRRSRLTFPQRPRYRLFEAHEPSTASAEFALAVNLPPPSFVHALMDIPHNVGDSEQLVLLGVLQLGNGASGAAIRQEIHARSGRDVSINAVYTTLDRLEDKGLLRSWVGEPTPERGG